jgi:L-amino acid N-acyltransferase
MNSTLTIRSASEADLPEILRIYNHAIEHTTAVFDYRPHTLEMRREWLRAKQAASLPVLIAEEAGALRGFATYGPFRAWPAYKYSIEHSVYVDPVVHRRGIGTALVNAVLAAARTADMHVVIAGITADNGVSLRLHERLGFKEVGHMSQVGFKFGKWLDLKLLQLVFDTPRTPTES